MSKHLTEKRSELAKRIHLMMIENDIVVIQGARIIGKLTWVPKTKQDEQDKEIIQ